MAASGRLNMMTNGVIRLFEGEDHHHVDEQDGDRHRVEEPAERLPLLLGDAGEPDVHARRDRPAVFRASTVTWADRETPPVSLLVMSAVIEAEGAWSIRVMLPCVGDLGPRPRSS